MTPVICHECGNRNPTKSSFCNKCGILLECNIDSNHQLQPENQVRIKIDPQANMLCNKEKTNCDFVKPTKDSSFKTKKIRILSVVLILSIIPLFFLPKIMLSNRYYGALSHMREGNYDYAIVAFAELGSYKESNTKMIECKYQLASEYMNDNNFANAIVIFNEILEYADVNNQIIEAYYLLGKENIENVKYLDAIDCLNKCSNYKDANELLKSSYYLLSKAYILEKDYENSVICLEKIRDYKDVNLIIIDTYYNYAVSEYIKGNFVKANALFDNSGSYHDSELYMENLVFLIRLQGTWKEINKYSGSLQVIINGWTLSRVYYLNNSTSVFDFTYTLTDNLNEIEAYDLYRLVDNNLSEYEYNEKTGDYNFQTSFSRVSGAVNTPEEWQRPQPRIGMTAKEVKESTWGTPKEINKTTTVYGVSEQWVYSGYKYIYLDDGIVTAIQE